MIWTLAILIFIVLGWYAFEGRWDRRLFKAEPGRVCVNVHPTEAKVFLDAHPDTQVLDVRSDAEFSGGALPGAIHISLGDAAFQEKLGKLDMAKPVLVYCAGGFRSRKAVAALKAQSFTNIQHLHRGYHSWQLARLPVQRHPSSTVAQGS
ncbi:MAG: rhodanese-like domain-containing protein [Prosthecobacter sp.]|uniref:rhodanese-like domain-containing protein n=1 Tax=Prosthecobacter sp. TaxID=1965333 RepID=UPI0038FEC97F